MVRIEGWTGAEAQEALGMTPKGFEAYVARLRARGIDPEIMRVGIVFDPQVLAAHRPNTPPAAQRPAGTMGRPRTLAPEVENDIYRRRIAGETLAALAAEHGCSSATISRVCARVSARNP